MPAFSRRLSPTLSNALSLLREELHSANEPLLDLTVSNPSSVLADYPHDEIRAAFSCIDTFNYAPDPWGIESARETIAQFHTRKGFTVSPASIALTASTSEAYSFLFKLFCDPGTEILVPAPSYPLFEFLASLEAVRLVPYRLHYDGVWSIDFDHLARQISPACRAIVVVNPNNPTGSFLKQWELNELKRLAAQHDLPVIADEVFMQYGFTRDPNRIETLIGDDDVLSFSLNGLSKSAGMPQMKLAWIVLNGPGYLKQILAERLEIILDTYLSVGTPVQRALPALLDLGSRVRNDLLARIRSNKAQSVEILAGTPAHSLHVEGGWSVIFQLPNTLPEEEWLYRLLKGQNVLMQPGYFFDMSAGPYAIASLIVEPEVFAEGVTRLRDLLSAG